jgi:hypothetical protein
VPSLKYDLNLLYTSNYHGGRVALFCIGLEQPMSLML